MADQQREEARHRGRILDIESSQVRSGEVARKLKSLDHFIYLYGHKAGYYLPPKDCLSWHYVSQILAEEKVLLKADKVGSELDLPKAKGFLITQKWQKYKEANKLHSFFPDFTQKQRIPRTYFFNVFS